MQTVLGNLLTLMLTDQEATVVHCRSGNISRGTSMPITLEIKDYADLNLAEIALCFDEDGLEVLIGKLNNLRGKIDHEHLMTPAWAGAELAEQARGGAAYHIVNHLRLVKFR